MRASLLIEDVVVSRGESLVVRGVSLQVRPGEVVGLLGRNGAGKSTLIRAVAGVERVRSGRMVLELCGVHAGPPVDITRFSPRRRAEFGIGYMPQGLDVFGDLTVDDNIAAARLTAWGDHKGCRERNASRVSEVMDMLPVLREHRSSRADALSGGQQRALLLGMLLVRQPRYLLLDEPTLGMDASLLDVLKRVIRTVAAAGGWVMLVEQKLRIAAEVADEVYVLDAGRVCRQLAGRDLLADAGVAEQFFGLNPAKVLL